VAFDSPFWYDRIQVGPDGTHVRLFSDPTERRVSLRDG
jgi:hypothetical protein